MNHDEQIADDHRTGRQREQVGAAVAALGAGAIRTVLGEYRLAFILSGALCLVAALFSLAIARQARAPGWVVAPGS